jgi:hypothetical protein
VCTDRDIDHPINLLSFQRSFNAFQKEVIENEERVARNVPPKHPPLVREHPKERPMIETQVKHYEIDGIRLAPLSSSH